jgi:hypothetical protein
MIEFETLDEAMRVEGEALVAAGERAKGNGDVAEVRRVVAALRDLGARHEAQADVLRRAHDLLAPYWPMDGTFAEALENARAAGDLGTVDGVEKLMVKTEGLLFDVDFQ